MISVEQIRNLESKVHSAVDRIRALGAENQRLTDRLGEYEVRVSELQRMIDAFKVDQAEIESGIIAALRQLDQLEDSVGDESPPASATRPAAPAAPAPPPEASPDADEKPTVHGDPVVETDLAGVELPDEAESTEEEDDEDPGAPELDIF